MLIVYKVQRQAQEPVYLDIEHPRPSPQSTVDAVTPHRSPPHENHFATLARRPLLDAQAWESPAFLKRNHFALGYEEYATEEEAEFPDNDRRKRSKFGRGSGQWRFAETTPSPENETNADNFEVFSPSRLQNEDRAIYNAAGPELQRSQKIGDRAELNGEEEGVCEASESMEEMPIMDEHLDEKGQEMHGASDNINDQATPNAPLNPPSTTAELLESEVVDINPAAKEATSSSPLSIYTDSRSSESDQESGFEAEVESERDTSDGNVSSGPASDLGLDGFVFSRAEQPPKEHSLRESTIGESVRGEGDDAVNRSPDQETLPPSVSDTGQVRQKPDEGPSTIMESGHDVQISSVDSYIQNFEHEANGRETRDSLSFPPLSSDQSREQQDLEGPSLNAAKTSVNAELQGLQPEELAVETIEAAASVTEPLPSKSELAEPQETNKDQVKIATQPSKAKVEIIDLESDSNEEDVARIHSQQHTRSPSIALDVPGPKPSVHHSDFSTRVGIGTAEEPPPVQLLISSPSLAEHRNDAISQSNLATGKPLVQKGPPTPPSPSPGASMTEDVIEDSLPLNLGVETPPVGEEPASFTPLGQLPDIEEQDSNPQSTPNPRIDQFGLKIGARKTSLFNVPAAPRPNKETSPLAEQFSSPQPTIAQVSPKATPSADMRVDSQTSLVDLPATVQDSARVQSSKSQLMTPDETQRSILASQPSFNALQSPPDDDTLPTPRLTQSKSADSVVPIASRAPSPNANLPPPEKHEIPAKTERSDEKALVPQRPPTLIERLKAMKRLSSQTPQKMANASAISPWFAPKRSSIIVPDSEAESEIESLSENDRKSIKQNVTAKLQTPEKQGLLAKSFIRSLSQHGGIHSIASSPGYLPPSQPPPPGFRTSLSYFVPLATLQSHFALAVDSLAIVLNATPVTRAPSGAKDFNHTIYITDPSSSVLRLPVVTAQIFRSHDECFPVVEEGDALLLRDFKVQSFQRRLSLLSTRSSAWAVFRRNADVQVRGPPVEFGAEERGFARGLWRWWSGLDHGVKDGLLDHVPKDKKGRAISLDKKPNGRVLSNETKPVDRKEISDVKIKKEGIAGLGVDLPGSPGGTRESFRKGKFAEVELDLPSSQGKMRKASPKERPSVLDGIVESTEPPKRVLRPRGVRGMTERSESPLKALSRRSRSVFTGGLGEPESE